jgi:hypothetical protein
MKSTSLVPRISSLWITAGAVAALGTWICYDAIPGINWPLWTLAATAGLIAFTRPAARRVSGLTGAAAVLISAGAARSASEIVYVLVLLSVIMLLAMTMLLTARPSFARLTAGFAIAAPVIAIANAFVSALSRAVEATQLVRSPRARSALRGIAITLPILIAFALLLAVADPTFALWRNSIRDLVADWDFLPRTIFFIAMLGLVIGTYGYAALEKPAEASPAPHSPTRWLGSGERLMLIGGVTGLLWLFMAVQLSYLFGNLPRISGSGITFADYARRGFGEMTIVATATVLLIVASERYGARDRREKITRMVTYALIIAVLFLLGSAFYRVILYERAYGFTTARLYAQAFMIVVAAVLSSLTIEVAGELSSGRLFRRSFAAATIALLILIYWNHEAWIAKSNIDRFATTGKLDVRYLARDLSPDAIPTIIAGLSRLPEPTRSELRAAVTSQYQTQKRFYTNRWFEWNLGRTRARAALATLGLP